MVVLWNDFLFPHFSSGLRLARDWLLAAFSFTKPMTERRRTNPEIQSRLGFLGHARLSGYRS
jgi:hypothetical protein